MGPVIIIKLGFILVNEYYIIFGLDKSTELDSLIGGYNVLFFGDGRGIKYYLRLDKYGSWIRY